MGPKIISLFKKNYILIIIFLLALLFRLWKLDVYPDAIDEDEMALGYYGYSLSNFGTDEYGKSFPIYFKSVGDYKYGLYSYFAAPVIKIFGLTPFTTRLPSAVFGAISIISIYFLAKEIFKNNKVAYLTSFILALNPTHIHFSRVAYSNIMGAFFASVAILFFLKLLKKINFKDFLFTLIPFILSIFSYQAYRVTLPLLFIIITIIFYKYLSRKFLIALALFILLTLLSFVPNESRVRQQSMLTLIDTPSLVEGSSEDNISGVKLLFTRVFHNKILSFTLDFSNRYLSYFDPRFLFLQTSVGSERHSIPKVGLLYLIELPLLIFSIFIISKTLNNKLILIPLSMILVSPIASATIVGERSVTRSVFLVYAFSLILGYGIYQLFSFTKYKKILFIVVMTSYFMSMLFFYHQYTVHKIYHHPWNSDVGLKEMVLSINEKYKDNYQKIVVSRGHYIPFLFYTKSSPSEFINNTGIFSKLIFDMPYDCPTIGKKDVLYVCFGTKVPRGSEVIDVFRYKDSLPAIFLIDFNKSQDDLLPDRLYWGEEVNNITLDEKDYWPTDNNR